MPARKYDDELIDRVAEMRERGLSYGQIALKTGMRDSSVAWHCLRLGIVSPRVLPIRDFEGQTEVRGNHVVRRFTREEDERLLELEAAGQRICDIAKDLKRPRNSVQGRLMTLARRDEIAAQAAGNT